MDAINPVVALMALITTYFLMGITCSGLVVDAFHPPPPLWGNPLSKETTLICNFLSKETIKASIILALQADNENQFVPSEDCNALEEDDENNEGEIDELVSELTQKLEQVEGMWYSDDFYGPHGREWVKVSATLVGHTGTSALVAVKITGDVNVPSGRTTWKTLTWPELGGSNVPAQIQVRANPKDPNGFSWVEGRLTFLSKDQIVLSANFSPLFETKGTFYRSNGEEDRS